MNERITYEQVQQARRTMPDLVDIIRLLEPRLRQMAREGRCADHDVCRVRHIGVHWSAGN